MGSDCIAYLFTCTLVVFQFSWWLSLRENRWLSFSKTQFCGYSSFKSDLVGCFGLNSLEGGSIEKKMSCVGGGVD